MDWESFEWESFEGDWKSFEGGRHQFEFLKGQGLLPEHQFLDIACGWLRGGIHFIRYLDQGHYCGIDASAGHITNGYRHVQEFGLTDRDPDLQIDANFAFWLFDRSFDFALAQSLFSHLPAPEVERCLRSLRPVLDGSFYATFFRSEEYGAKNQKAGIVTYPDVDPYHYPLTTLQEIASKTGFSLKHLGPWGHPHGQEMLLFEGV